MGRPKKTDLALISKEWDYDNAVLVLKPMIDGWKKKTVEIVRLLYRANQELSAHGRRTDLEDSSSASKPRTWEEFCNAVGLEKRTANNWLALYDVQNDRLLTTSEAKERAAQIRDQLYESVRQERYNGNPDYTPEKWNDRLEKDYKLWLIEKGYDSTPDPTYMLTDVQPTLLYGDLGLFPESYVMDVAAKSIDRCSGDNALRFMKKLENAKERVPKGIDAREVVRISEMAMAAIEMFPAETRVSIGIICAEMLRDEAVEEFNTNGTETN